MKRIGILGGMGPLATIDLYAKIVELTNAAKDQDNIPIVIDNHPQIPDRTAYILHGGRDKAQKRGLRGYLHSLQYGSLFCQAPDGRVRRKYPAHR